MRKYSNVPLGFRSSPVPTSGMFARYSPAAVCAEATLAASNATAINNLVIPVPSTFSLRKQARILIRRSVGLRGRMEQMSANSLSVIPMLSYEDGIAALEWLAKAFGFRERTRMLWPDGRLSHGEMEAGDGLI